jgi:hypothetical protein
MRRATRIGAAVAIVVFAVFVAGGTLGGLTEHGPFSSDFFDEQADSLLDGRIDVDPEVVAIEGIRDDGKTYVYYGIFPALLRVPVAALSDDYDGRLTQLSMIAALAVALTSSGRLLWRGRRAVRGDRPLGRREPLIAGAFVAGVGVSSPMLFLAAETVVYHEVELWGTALALLTADQVLAWRDEPTGTRLALATLAATAALNTRASVGLIGVIALGLFFLIGLVRQRSRALVGVALAAAMPVLVYALVNVARFDHPFSVPWDQLADIRPAREKMLEANDGSYFAPNYVPTALVAYLRPDGIDLERHFPWVGYRNSTWLFGDPAYDVVDRTASLPVVTPLLLVLGTVGVVRLCRRGSSGDWRVVTAAAAISLVPTVAIAFIANRYLSDFVPLLVVAGSIGTWVAVDYLRAASRRRRRVLVVGAFALAAAGFSVTAALTLQSQRLFILPNEDERRGFVALQRDIDETLSGDGADDVTIASALPRRARAAGSVIIVGSCDALFWSDGRAWHALERGPEDQRTLIGPLGQGRTELVSGDGWTLDALRDGDEVVVEYAQGDDVRRGPPSDVDDLRTRDGDDVELRVTNDPTTGEVIVMSGDHAVFGTVLVVARGPVVGGTGWRVEPARTPLCDELRERLDGDDAT